MILSHPDANCQKHSSKEYPLNDHDDLKPKVLIPSVDLVYYTDFAHILVCKASAKCLLPCKEYIMQQPFC